jgi:1-deoxyxylulose-5-phosphate synthase
MEFVRLGHTGLQVSRLCLGTMTFGLQCDEPTSHAILDRAVNAGVNFIDTANVYPIGGDWETRGRTEEIIGRWLRGRREEVIVATKCSSAMGPEPWRSGSSRKHILHAIDASLHRLGTDYVDLYQLHKPDPKTPIDETLDAMDAVVRAGKARYIGCSNSLAYQIARAIGRSEAQRLIRFETVQPRYNLLFRQPEREIFPFCIEEGLGVLPYNPIAGGLLTGKHHRDHTTEGSRFTLGTAGERYRKRYWHDQEFDAVAALAPLAEQAGMSLTTMAVAWVLANPAVTAPIIGASRPEQLFDSLAAADVLLDNELKTELDELTRHFRTGDATR